MSRLQLAELANRVEEAFPFPSFGHVTKVLGFVIEGYCPEAVVGGVCEVYSKDQTESFLAEVVGFNDDRTILMPFGEVRGIGMGSLIALREKSATVKLGMQLIGRIIDGLGNPMDGGPELECEEEYSIYASPINPLKRNRIHEPLDVGVRAINSLLTAGKGQRVGIIAGSGVGKSVLLGMMARNTQADVNVIGLIGERGREVREFIERDLGQDGMQRSVLVVAPSDASPVIRMRAVYVAATIAEYFRKHGKDVLFMMDSVTRFAMAQREVGLSAGEPPTTKGYPPSVFTAMPKLFERAGTTSSEGSITGIYTVLVEGDDMNDPIGDAVRSIVDGHILLSRKMAAKNHFPAIDITHSASRVMSDIVPEEHWALASRVRNIISTYQEAEDLINIGAYVKGSNASIDESLLYIDAVNQFLKQPMNQNSDFQTSLAEMKKLFQVDPRAPRPGVGKK